MLLCHLLPELDPTAGLAGLALKGVPDEGEMIRLAADRDGLRLGVEERFEELERLLAVGPYQRYLPEHCRQQVVTALSQST